MNLEVSFRLLGCLLGGSLKLEVLGDKISVFLDQFDVGMVGLGMYLRAKNIHALR